MVNPLKLSNFIIGELLNGGQLSFVIENLPKTNPRTGCPGKWLFQQMMLHFGTSVTAIQGNWIGTQSDNLSRVNGLTSGGSMTVEDAAKLTWTGMRASHFGFIRVRVIGVPSSSAGHYKRVNVLFER